MPEHDADLLEAARDLIRRVRLRGLLVPGLVVAVMVLATVAALRYSGARAEARMEGLVGQLSDESPDERSRAATDLVAAGERAIPALCDCLRRHEDDEVRKTAAKVLTAMGEPAVPALTGCLTDPDARARELAATALGDIGPPAAGAAPMLTRLLRDESPDVRDAAEGALTKLGDQQGLRGLLDEG